MIRAKTAGIMALAGVALMGVGVWAYKDGPTYLMSDLRLKNDIKADLRKQLREVGIENATGRCVDITPKGKTYDRPKQPGTIIPGYVKANYKPMCVRETLTGGNPTYYRINRDTGSVMNRFTPQQLENLKKSGVIHD